jgi:hypothetical protein
VDQKTPRTTTDQRATDRMPVAPAGSADPVTPVTPTHAPAHAPAPAPALPATTACAHCGTVEKGLPLTWTCSVESGSRVYFCVTCARRHLRSIEGRLGSALW